MTSEEGVLSPCPRCGEQVEDNDGFGVLVHEKCGLCVHPSFSGDVCDVCGFGGVNQAPWFRKQVHVLAHDDKDEKGKWEELVPDELNDLLRELVPGSCNRNFRLSIRKAFVDLVLHGIPEVHVSLYGAQQQVVLDALNKMVEAKLVLKRAGMDGWPGLARAK